MSVSSDERDPRKLAMAIQQVEQGRLNVSGTVTLRAGQTTTAVSAMNCGTASQVQLTAKTANAAAALGTTFVSSVSNGSFTITHANSAQTDRTFGWSFLG